MKNIIVAVALILSIPVFADSYDYEEYIEDVYESECGTSAECVGEVMDREGY